MTNRKKWRRRLAVALGGLVLASSVGVGVVYWQYFRKDPAFLEEKRQSDQTQQELDDLFADELPDESAGAEG
jgi:type II secretory pathway component PulL